MGQHTTSSQVLGPWSLATSRQFWTEFTPAALGRQSVENRLTTRFLSTHDYTPVKASISQDGDRARIELRGRGDLSAAAEQVERFLGIDVDGRDWPRVLERDPVLAEVQATMPGLRPCGFFSPYEAAAWAVLSQRVRMTQAAVLRDSLLVGLGEDGAFPTPDALLSEDLDLPGRKPEYLRAVAEAALDGVLDAAQLRATTTQEAIERVRSVKGLGPFAAELVFLRGANAPDAAPAHEARLQDVVRQRYGPDAELAVVAEAWRPYRTWASFCLRAHHESHRSAAT